MKKQIISILLLACLNLCANAQMVIFKYRKWKDPESFKIINISNKRLTIALSQTGFNDQDTIKLNFDYPKEYVVVTHNLPDNSERITILSRQVLLHITTLKHLAAHYKVQNLKIYVRLSRGRYLLFDDEEIRIEGEKVKIKDRLFKL